MTAHITEVGTLQKGDMCIVSFPERKAPWLCRVVASLPYEEGTLRNSMYECVTPHGSSLVTGALWVRPAIPSEVALILELEAAVKATGKRPYRGLIRFY